ncbi:hypothetical protein E4665_06795 [Sporolactobacillus shoreae]|uniref:Uncharacterized protein n=1 Tax=Sporolactobacillus shoreae TaxID=1465501 RepID=A0A4Z0GPB5_9BACL|nr:hypothetical protein [Sporolactobacillus shoreae]TGA99020.1 hypothetical protein E4665_06795 [Sporolactobacillus shoreae]
MYQNKLDHLAAIKDYIGEEQYRLCAAAILTEHYIKSMRIRTRNIRKMQLFEIVNLHLRFLGIEEVSYSFIRLRADRDKQAG